MPTGLGKEQRRHQAEPLIQVPYGTNTEYAQQHEKLSLQSQLIALVLIPLDCGVTTGTGGEKGVASHSYNSIKL